MTAWDVLIGSVATALAALAPVAVARAPTNEQIAGIQVALHEAGFYAGPLDGVAGARYVRAVRTFQRRHRLRTTGIADARTRTMLGPLGRPAYGSRPLRRGAVGLDVSSLQFELARHGFPVYGVEHGRFDGRTEAAVEAFQRFSHVQTTGRVGRRTRDALAAPPARSPFAFPRPVPGPIFRSYGPVGMGFSPGVEIRAAYGTPVAAAAGGRVVHAGWSRGGLGYTVELAHRRGVSTLYGHLARTDVRVGNRVAAGAWLGVVGWTGTRSHRPSLHFQVRVRQAVVPPRFAPG